MYCDVKPEEFQRASIVSNSQTEPRLLGSSSAVRGEHGMWSPPSSLISCLSNVDTAKREGIQDLKSRNLLCILRRCELGDLE